MSWQLQSDSTPTTIVEFVRDHGIAVIPKYITDADILSKLKTEALAATTSTSSNYNFGNAVRFGPLLPKIYPTINGLIKQPDLQEIIKLVNRTHQETFVTHEFKSGVMERNGYLHFDRTYTFKLFFYLTDVDIDCGPFRAVMDSHHLGKKLRTATKKQTTDYGKLRNRPAIDYPELGYTEDDGEPVLGEAGTLIIFDTDTLHKGGLVQPGRERMILRTHSR